jgi:hypothetical protein
MRKQIRLLDTAVRDALERHAMLGESVAVLKQGRVRVIAARSLVRKPRSARKSQARSVARVIAS